MTEPEPRDDEYERLTAFIREALEQALTSKYEPATPDAVKRHLIDIVKSAYSDPPLEDGVDYRIDIQGMTITVTPLSQRCIDWFRETLTPVKIHLTEPESQA